MMAMYKSKVVHIVMVSILAFVPLGIFINPVNLYLLLGSVLFFTCMTTVVSYWPALAITLKRSVRDIDMTDVLTLSIVTIFAFTAAREAYVTFYRELFPLTEGRSDDYYIPLAFIRYGEIVAALLAVYSRRKEGRSFMYRVPGWPYAFLSVLAGVLFGTFLMAVKASL